MKRTGIVLAVLLTVLVPRLARTQQGAPQGPEFRVNTYITSNQLYPTVARASGGNFVVVWTSNTQDGSGLGIFGQRFLASGAPLGPEFRVNTYTTGSQYLGVVASDPAGNFVVVWTSVGQDGPSLGAFGQRFAATGAPLGPEFRVNAFTTSDQALPRPAMDSAGNFVVTWISYQQDGSSWGAYAQRFNASGAPVGAEFRVNTYTTGAQYRPTVASDSTGNFTIVWDSPQDGSLRGIVGQRFSSTGAPVGTEFRVNTFTTSSQYLPVIAADPAGDFVVAWMSYLQDGDLTGVFAQRFAASGAPAGPEFQVNLFTPSYQVVPSAAMDASGHFVVTWGSYGQDGSSYGVFGRRFLNTGAPQGPEFQINTFTTLGQNRPTVAADALGNFVVTWDSQVQDGSLLGVFGQRYGQIVPVELMHVGVE